MAVFFLLLSFYFLLRGCRKNSYWLIGFASLSLGVSITVREAMLFMVPFFLILFLRPQVLIRPFSVNIPKEKFELRFLVALVLPLLFILGVLFSTYFGTVLYRTLFLQNMGTASFKGLLTFSLYKAFNDVLKMTSVLGVFCFIAGIIKMLRKESIFVVVFILLWFMTIFFYGNSSSYSPRYLDLVMIPVWIGVAYGIVSVCCFSKIIPVFVLGVLILGMVMPMYPMLDFRHNYNGEKQFAVYVQGVTEHNAVILGVDDTPFIEYYGKRKTLTIPVEPVANMDVFLKDVELRLNSGVPVYLMGSFASYDRAGVLSGKINNRFQLLKVGQFLSEDFHRPEFNFYFSYEDLYKVLLK